jgi:Catalase
LTVGPDGPIPLHDHYFIDQLAQFNREGVPERQPHAKGSERPRAVRGDALRPRFPDSGGVSARHLD